MLSNRLIHLQPDLIILFASLNDFSKNISKYDYSHFGKQPFPSALRWHQKSTRFQIARRVYYAFVSEERYRQQITMKTRYRRFVAYEQSFPLSDSTPYINTEDYRKNLEGFAGTCQYNKIPVIFMTNQTTWGTTDSILQRSHWLCIRSGVRYRHQKMDSGLNVYNNAMRAVAEAHAIPLFDLPAIIPKSRQYFYDDCHFTNEGVAFTARSLAVFIREKNILQ
jgi:lysophospholipase L1-like esterase